MVTLKKIGCKYFYLHAVRDAFEENCEKAVIVASDGDYASLVEFLKGKDKFMSLLSPSNKCSYLLRKLNIPIVYLDTKKNKLGKSSE